MKNKILIGVLVSFLVISVVAVTASIAANDKAKEEPKGPDEKAKAPDLEKTEFIHWKKGFAKPPCNNDGVCDPEENPSCPDCKNGGGEEPPEPTTACYAFIGQYGKRLLKWKKLPVTYVINPTDSGLNEGDVTTAISAGAEEWDIYAGPELFNDTYTVDNSATYGGVPDEQNVLSFGNYPTTGVIAVTTVWYNPATKQIVEFDILFDTDFEWGDATADSTVMDLQNIATHELGHGVGLDDVYEDTCSEVTMYGYSVEGETKKSTLEEPDVIGILELYP
ncbi:MAG: matrixin family metalloprotease [Planctomycetota bacterium]